MSDRTNGDTPDDIENRIRATQDDLRNDLDALEDKVSPENLKRQAKERVDETSEAVRDKALETTRQVGDTVRSRIEETSERFRNDDRMNAMSLLGLAAVIGLGLLVTRMTGREERHRYDRHDRFERDPGRGPTHGDDRYGYAEAPDTTAAYRSPRS